MREEIVKERRALKAEYGDLFDAVANVLFRADPVGISFDNPNLDEYEPEAGTILPRLKDCVSADDALRVVHEEFTSWFDADTAGAQEHYQQIAFEIWKLWTERRADETGSAI